METGRCDDAVVWRRDVDVANADGGSVAVLSITVGVDACVAFGVTGTDELPVVVAGGLLGPGTEPWTSYLPLKSRGHKNPGKRL